MSRENAIHRLCGRKLRVDFPASDPQRFSTGTEGQSVDNRASANRPEGTIDLIIFDGKFDRLCPTSSWTYGLPAPRQGNAGIWAQVLALDVGAQVARPDSGERRPGGVGISPRGVNQLAAGATVQGNRHVPH
jgi:hypothetical protein